MLLFLFIAVFQISATQNYRLEHDKMIDANQIHSRYHTEFWNGNVKAFDISESILISTDSRTEYDQHVLSDSLIVWQANSEIDLLASTDSVYWLQFSLENKLDKDFSAYLFFNAWRKIELYQIDSNHQVIDYKITGNYLKLSERDVENRRIPFIQINLHKNEHSSYLVRLLRGGPEFWFDDSNKKVSVLLYTESDILQTESTLLLILGFAVGLVVTMILFNFFLYIITKNLGALFNGLFLLFWEFFYITVYGIGFEYFWPNSVFWDFHAHSFFIAFCIASLCQFFRYSLDLKETNKWFNNYFQIITLATLLIIITQLYDLRNWNELFINLLFTATFAAGVIVNYKSWKGGHNPAKYYLIGITYMHVFQLFIALSQNGILPYFYGAITNFDIVQYGGSIQVALYSFGLVIAYKESLDNLVREANMRSIAEIKADSYRELERNKSNFFSTISHEFRTPLTLILGAIDSIKKVSTKDKQIDSISTNSKRLLRLINQLLDFSKIENKQMTVQLHKYDLIKFTKYLVSNFKSAASEKGLKLQFSSDLDELSCDLDFPKIEKVILNLLSNAVKFTDKGQVNIKLSRTDQTIHLGISDTGIGIAADHIDSIFDRFYQVDQESQRQYEGTGIGLALCKEIVELHNGLISVSSELDNGSSIQIELPYQNSESITQFQINQNAKHHEVELSTIDIDQSETVTISQNGNQQQTLLLIEDHKEMRQYIKGLLETDYHILEAHNGVKGIELAKQEIPDLILTDIMMPQMDGMQLIDQLKQQFETRHIPIIIISGKAEETGKLDGLSRGAIDYLVKPFNQDQLRVKISAVLDQFKLYKKRLMKLLAVQSIDESVTNADEQFLIDLKQYTIEHLSDADVQLISSHFALSESTLFRKLKALTGAGINPFIRQVKLDYAYQLLKTTHKTVSEVSNQCGFNSVSHFTKSFKECFGHSPSELNKSA